MMCLCAVKVFERYIIRIAGTCKTAHKIYYSQGKKSSMY